MKDHSIQDCLDLRQVLHRLVQSPYSHDCQDAAREVLARTDRTDYGQPHVLGGHRVLLSRELCPAGLGFRSARVVLVECIGDGPREYVVARHYDGDSEWTHGNYHRTFAHAAETFDSMTASCEASK